MTNTAIVGPTFFGYGTAVRQIFEKMGHPARFFNERLNDSLFTKAVYRSQSFQKIFSFYLTRQRARLISDILLYEARTVIFISPEYINGDDINELKKHGCRVICYMWDSFLNKPAALQFLDYFDAVATFDPTDAKHYDLKLINLFAEEEFKVRSSETLKNRPLEIAYIGTSHSNRFAYLSVLLRYFDKIGGSINIHAFHGNFIYYLRNLILFGFNTHKLGTWKKLSKAEIADVFKSSKIVLDITHPNQDGLTSRTFEALAASAILLTNNPNTLKLLPEFEDQIVLYNFESFEGALTLARSKARSLTFFRKEEYLFIDRFVTELLEMIA